MTISLLRDNPLTVEAGGTDFISASNNLAVSDTNYTDAQLTYTVVTAPSDGTLLGNGVATSTFTQADLDNNLVSYKETGSQASSDSFFFSVSDPANNQIGATFQLNITPEPVNETATSHITVQASLTAAIGGLQIAYYGASSEQLPNRPLGGGRLG